LFLKYQQTNLLSEKFISSDIHYVCGRTSSREDVCFETILKRPNARVSLTELPVISRPHFTSPENPKESLANALDPCLAAELPEWRNIPHFLIVSRYFFILSTCMVGWLPCVAEEHTALSMTLFNPRMEPCHHPSPTSTWASKGFFLGRANSEFFQRERIFLVDQQ